MNSVLDDRSTETWVSPQQTYDAVVVGNVTMLLLLLGVDPTPLSMSPFTPAFMDQLNVEAREVGLHIHPHGYVQTLPALGAYVGADIVAGGPAATGRGARQRRGVVRGRAHRGNGVRRRVAGPRTRGP